MRYPPNYPDVAPHIELSLDNSSPKLSLDFPTDRDTILNDLATTIEDSLGMAMIFTIVVTIKEAAEALMQDRFSAVQNAKEEVKRIEEEKEMAKFRGTPVTKESFMIWRAKFQQDMDALKKQKEKEKEEEDKGKRGTGQAAVVAAEAFKKRLTGKQLYTLGMVGNEDDVEIDGNEVDLAKLKLQDGGK